MDILKTFLNIEETGDTLYSIIIYDKNTTDIIKYIDAQIEKAKKITNPSKKYKINNRLYCLLKYISENYEETIIINSIFFINDSLYEYKLSDVEIKIAQEYNFQKLYFKCDNKFNVNYIIDLFTNFNFIYTIKLLKNNLSIIKMNKNKEIEIENSKVNNENELLLNIDKIRNFYNYKDLIIINGICNLKLDLDISNVLNVSKIQISMNVNIYELYENNIIEKNNILLEKRLNDLKNEKTNIDLYVFGRLKFEIKEAIETYSLKELYIQDIKLEKLKTFIDESYLNFKIIPIKRNAESFIKDYNGIMGIKYF